MVKVTFEEIRELAAQKVRAGLDDSGVGLNEESGLPTLVTISFERHGAPDYGVIDEDYVSKSLGLISEYGFTTIEFDKNGNLKEIEVC